MNQLIATKMNLSKLIIYGAALALPMTISAQTVESGYFTNGYLYRYQLNPAIANEQSFVSFPALGNINATTSGTLSLKDVLYNVDGHTTTFMNPGVSTEEFMSNIKDRNRIGGDVKVGILAVGFHGMKGYNTITVNLRTNVNAELPGSLFSLLKEGVENKSYDLSNVDVNATAWAEVAFGHSHRINNRLRIGATIKGLIGGGNVDAKFRKAKLNLGQEYWDITTDGYLNASIKGLRYEMEHNDRTNRDYVNSAKIDGGGIDGYGVAVDLGVEYKIDKAWKLSLSVTDLGAIRWDNNMVASTNGEQNVKTSDYTFDVDKDADNSFKQEWKNMRDKLSLIYQLENNGDMGRRTTMLGATVRAAAEYTLPHFKKLSFGLLGTTYIHGDFSSITARLSANYAPSRFLSMSINGSYGTYGAGFGWIFNLHPTGFNLFLASDCVLFKLAKQGVPLSSNANVSIGLNIPF
jgi:hypothetical protein